MSWGAIKRTLGDATFSEYVREKAHWICEWPGCYKDFSKNHSGLDCSHFKTRGNPRVRFDLDNVAALCKHHHDFAGKNPDEHDAFFRRRLGETGYSLLIVRANSRRKERLDHKFEAIRWKAALKDLKRRRDGVVFGRKA
jgi:hypothetical protein